MQVRYAFPRWSVGTRESRYAFLRRSVGTRENGGRALLKVCVDKSFEKRENNKIIDVILRGYL
jgi:hypothetical protein